MPYHWLRYPFPEVITASIYQNGSWVSLAVPCVAEVGMIDLETCQLTRLSVPRMVWEADGIEVRQLDKRPVIAGRFPYNSLAVLSDRGTVRKETIMPGAFSFTLGDPSREVNLLFGHSFDRPLDSRSSGTLELWQPFAPMVVPGWISCRAKFCSWAGRPQQLGTGRAGLYLRVRRTLASRWIRWQR